MRKDSMRCGTRGENLVLYFPSPSFLVKASSGIILFFVFVFSLLFKLAEHSFRAVSSVV